MYLEWLKFEGGKLGIEILNFLSKHYAAGKLMPSGYGIEWETLDEHLSIDSLIHDHVSTETWRSIYEWYEIRREFLGTTQQPFGPVTISA